MCGTNSFGVVSGKDENAMGITSAGIVFLVNDDGTIGQSHSAIRHAAGINDKARFQNANVVEGEVKYEKGEAKWYTKAVKAETEKALVAIEKKMKVAGPAYAAKLEVARTAREAACAAADKAFETAQKRAFVTIKKLGGIRA